MGTNTKLGPLGKTETRILEYMRERGRYGATRSHGHGAEGGKVGGGDREFDACRKLVKRGLAVQVGDIYRHTVTRRGWGEHVSEITIVLAPETPTQKGVS